MTTYNWDLIERLLHEVQHGESSFTPARTLSSTQQRRRQKASRPRTWITSKRWPASMKSCC